MLLMRTFLIPSLFGPYAVTVRADQLALFHFSGSSFFLPAQCRMRKGACQVPDCALNYLGGQVLNPPPAHKELVHRGVGEKLDEFFELRVGPAEPVELARDFFGGVAHIFLSSQAETLQQVESRTPLYSVSTGES